MQIQRWAREMTIFIEKLNGANLYLCTLLLWLVLNFWPLNPTMLNVTKQIHCPSTQLALVLKTGISTNSTNMVLFMGLEKLLWCIFNLFWLHEHYFASFTCVIFRGGDFVNTDGRSVNLALTDAYFDDEWVITTNLSVTGSVQRTFSVRHWRIPVVLTTDQNTIMCFACLLGVNMHRRLLRVDCIGSIWKRVMCGSAAGWTPPHLPAFWSLLFCSYVSFEAGKSMKQIPCFSVLERKMSLQPLPQTLCSKNIS